MLEIYDIFNMQTNRQKGLEILFVLLVDTFVEDIVVSFGKCYNGKKEKMFPRDTGSKTKY